VDAWGAPFLLKLLEDPYPAVRYIAARSLKALPKYAEMDYDFLSDPVGTHEEREKLFLLWEQTKRVSLQGRRPLLMDDQGNLDRTWLEALLKERDDREIFLAE
jgi:hypothetical protein